MTQSQIESLKAHFLEWSGGFEPESEHQITVYVDYAANCNLDRDDVRRILEEWLFDDQNPESEE
ncbi:MAG TPA: hypothetical protein VFE47_10770 [Tepidisphaeraceae bacterium]|nr:hypothetical protein [Tepidisphaeraceae bacterium]